MTLQISGTGFTSASIVTFDGTTLSSSFLGATQLSAVVPATALATAPAGDAANVVVTNPAPGGGASAPFTFGVASAASTLAGSV